MHEVLNGFWAPELRNAWDGYRDMAFPFDEIKWPNIEMTKDWTLEQLAGYMLSWSSSQKYIDKHKRNPMTEVGQELLNVWGNPDSKKRVSWQIMGRIGRKP